MVTILTQTRPGARKGDTSIGAHGTTEGTTVCLKAIRICRMCRRSQRGSRRATVPALQLKTKRHFQHLLPHHLKSSSSDFIIDWFYFVSFYFLFFAFILYLTYLLWIRKILSGPRCEVVVWRWSVKIYFIFSTLLSSQCVQRKKLNLEAKERP
jgi:hypothetical protein